MNQALFINKLKPVFSSENLTIYEPDEDGIMLANWSGFLTASIAKENCLAMLNCLDKYPVSKILNSNIKVTGHHAGAIDWLGKVWFPGLFERGVLYFAWIYSKEFYTQISTDEAISFDFDVLVKTFYEFETAHQWLLAQ